MQAFKMTALCCAFALISSLGLQAQEMIENPLYKHWAQFGVGTYSTVEVISKTGPNETKIVTTSTLKEKTDESVSVESKVVMHMMGREMAQPARIDKFAAKIAKPKAVEGEKAPKPKTGKETVKVAGQEVECTWVDISSEVSGMKTTGKAWSSDKVPGMTVKMESETKGPTTSKTTSKLVKFEIKK